MEFLRDPLPLGLFQHQALLQQRFAVAGNLQQRLERVGQVVGRGLALRGAVDPQGAQCGTQTRDLRADGVGRTRHARVLGGQRGLLVAQAVVLEP